MGREYCVVHRLKKNSLYSVQIRTSSTKDKNYWCSFNQGTKVMRQYSNTCHGSKGIKKIADRLIYISNDDTKLPTLWITISD